MQYFLSVSDTHAHYIDVVCRIEALTGATLTLHLPAWRPGRYELQHFAKNIRTFAVFDQDNRPLACHKISKECWQLAVGGATALEARYSYFGLLPGKHRLDAGSSYADSDHFWCINPVNLCVYAPDRLGEACTLRLQIPDGWQIACGLPLVAYNTVFAPDYYALADSPILASGTLQAVRYSVPATTQEPTDTLDVTVWVQGWNRRMPPAFDPEQMRSDFARFTQTQIALFGDFPRQGHGTHYHFLTVVLPVAYYHGVEHRNSTLLVLGPELEGLAADGTTLEGAGLYTDLLGVASHELFHAWNICRIRPAELLPYKFEGEQYFTTGFVVEGITTYYGDLLLCRAGVFDQDTYLKEVLVNLKRHFEPSGRAALSLAEASWDLWLDGYTRAAPHRTVSVYHKGAIVALILDLYLRRTSAHTRSLDTVMRRLWQRFGPTQNGQPQQGYTYADFRALVADVAHDPLNWYFDQCITGNVPVEALLNEQLAFVGLQMHYDAAGLVLLHNTATPAALTERARWLGNQTAS